MSLKIIGKTTNIPNNSDIHEVEKELNFSFPLSYVNFIKEYGTGLLCGLFIIYVPHSENINFDIEKGNEEFQQLTKDWLSMGWKLQFRSEHMFCFGASENGDLLLWDKAEKNFGGEFPIYIIGHEMEEEKPVLVAHTLDEFVSDFCVGCKIDKLFPVGQGQRWDLPATFTVIK